MHELGSCQVDMVAMPFIRSFQNVWQISSRQLQLNDMVHYLAAITYHCYGTWSTLIDVNDHRAVVTGQWCV